MQRTTTTSPRPDQEDRLGPRIESVWGRARALRGLRKCIALIALLSASGCFTARDTTNEPLDAEKIASLEPGETRAAEVVELLGAPSEVVQLARRSAYRYDYINSKRSGLFLIVANFLNEDTRSDRLWVFFDEDQVLSHFGVTLQGDASVHAMPWEPIHGED